MPSNASKWVKTVLFYQIFIIILLLTNFWALSRLIGNNLENQNWTNTALEKFKEKYQVSATGKDTEEQRRLVSGFVERFEKTNESMAKATGGFASASERLCFYIIGITLLNMVFCFVAIKVLRKDRKVE